jgi:hypothetical protein
VGLLMVPLSACKCSCMSCMLLTDVSYDYACNTYEPAAPALRIALELLVQSGSAQLVQDMLALCRTT